ncbi:MAG TPA: hypothetical protein DEQ62_08465, partial [Verrucomicrobiales bacterium]|nr:hypothetical protein [Verrucomicrobiales bacterium]
MICWRSERVAHSLHEGKFPEAEAEQRQGCLRKDMFEGAATQNTRARCKLIGPGHGDDYGFGSGRVADAGGAVE